MGVKIWVKTIFINCYNVIGFKISEARKQYGEYFSFLFLFFYF